MRITVRNREIGNIRPFSITIIISIIIMALLVAFFILPFFSIDVSAQNGSGSDPDNDGNDDDSTDVTTFALIMIFIGVVILLMEPFIPGLFLAIPGTVLVSVGAVGLIAPDLMFTPVALLVGASVGVISFLAAIKFYKMIAPNQPPSTTVADSLIGREGIVTVETDPDHRTKGKVRIGSQIWSAYANTVIPEGAKVKVIASEGVHVKVQRIPNKRRGVKRSAVSNDDN